MLILTRIVRPGEIVRAISARSTASADRGFSARVQTTALTSGSSAANMMIEQPLDYDDVMDHVQLQRQLKTRICLDESIKTVTVARDAIAAGACRIINIKPGRVGGFAESVKLHDLCAAHGIPVWHGGMLESGIGRAANIHLSTLPNFSLPGDIAASKRYFDPDLIDPAITVGADGTIPVPTGPGIGVAIREDRVDAATIKRAQFGA